MVISDLAPASVPLSGHLRARGSASTRPSEPCDFLMVLQKFPDFGEANISRHNGLAVRTSQRFDPLPRHSRSETQCCLKGKGEPATSYCSFACRHLHQIANADHSPGRYCRSMIDCWAASPQLLLHSFKQSHILHLLTGLPSYIGFPWPS